MSCNHYKSFKQKYISISQNRQVESFWTMWIVIMQIIESDFDGDKRLFKTASKEGKIKYRLTYAR
jgi:hypothetical protein